MKYNLRNHRRNVLELQTMLRANHLLEGGILINPDGIFAAETAEAIRLFQRQNGLEITGIADFPTWNLLAQNTKDLCKEVPCLPLP